MSLLAYPQIFKDTPTEKDTPSLKNPWESKVESMVESKDESKVEPKVGSKALRGPAKGVPQKFYEKKIAVEPR